MIASSWLDGGFAQVLTAASLERCIAAHAYPRDADRVWDRLVAGAPSILAHVAAHVVKSRLRNRRAHARR